MRRLRLTLTVSAVTAAALAAAPRARVASASPAVVPKPDSAHRRGWVADIEVLRPGATKWAWLRTNVTTVYASFTPQRAGTFRLRARLRDKLSTKFSAFSPIRTIRVS